MKNKILVVDDEEHIRLIYKEEFEEEGYNVLLASNGEDALAQVESNLPDLFILDIKMPGIDGITLARKIKEIKSDVPVIFVSAYEDYKHDFGTWASDIYFCKSADLSELKEIIKKLLSKEGIIYDKLKKNGSPLEQAIIKKIKRFDKRINCISYGEKIKRQIDELKDKTIDIISFLQKLYGQTPTDYLTEEEKEKLFKLLKDAQKAANYCNILIENYSNVFLNPELTLHQTNINELLDEVLNVLANEITYSLRRNYKLEDTLITDKRLLKHIIFVILKNINDYLYENSGYLNIITSKAIQKHNNKKDVKYVTEFHFGVANNLLCSESMATEACFSKQEYEELIRKFPNTKDTLKLIKNDINNKVCFNIDKISDNQKEDLGEVFNKIKNHLSKILIVDDDKHIQELLKEDLSEEGYNIFLASNGYECLDLIAQQNFNLIILDMKMVGMKGFEVLETLRQNRKNKHIPVIIYSGSPLVTTPSFREQVSIFDPVRTLEKGPNIEITHLIDELIKTFHRPFSFKDIFDLDLEESIRQDNILNTGFFSAKKVLKLINGDITFLDYGYEKKCIKLELPILLSSGADSNKVQYTHRNSAKASYLDKLNEHFTHDLKNKLFPIKYDLCKIDMFKISEINKWTINAIKENIDKCIQLLIGIKNTPII